MPSVNREKQKPEIRFNVSRKKLSLALQRLAKPVEYPLHQGVHSLCNKSLVRQLNTAAFVQPVVWKRSWHELFQMSATRHDWDSFSRTLRLASQNHTFCGLRTITRNTIFSVFTHPMFKDPMKLRLLLYTVAPCRNEQDIEFCVQRILQTLGGETEAEAAPKRSRFKRKPGTVAKTERPEISEKCEDGREENGFEFVHRNHC